MSSTVLFLERLLRLGEAVLHDRPSFSSEERPALMRLLEAAHSQFRLDVAGAVVPFDPHAGLAGAKFLSQACWFLVSGDEKPDLSRRGCIFRFVPANPEAHLSGDLCLRYLAAVHRPRANSAS